MKEEIKPHSHIKDALDKFIQHIESLYDSLPLTMMIVDLTKKSARNNFNDFLKEKNISKTSDNGSVSYQIKIEDFTKFKRLKKRLDSSFISERIIPESFFVSLISHYDAFLGDLIRALFIIRPEVLNSSEKKMAFSELLKFKSIEDAREFVIEKEIESVLRESHSAQFDWLENKFNIKLREDLPCWPKFIEITERRNLYVHCNGVVSSQYINTCLQNNYTFDKEVKVGDRLEIDPDYFTIAYHTFFEIGVKLSNVFWRKFLADDIENADGYLNEICYDLILIENYELAITLLEFSIKILKKHADRDKKVFIINLAQAYKWNGNKDDMEQLLKKEDWTACKNDFQLAVSVLKDDYDNAFRLMELIGKNEDIRVAYKEWPLFKEFRKDKRFGEIYKKIFDEEFTLTEFKDVFNIKDPKSDKQKIKKNLTSGSS